MKSVGNSSATIAFLWIYDGILNYILTAQLSYPALCIRTYDPLLNTGDNSWSYSTYRVVYNLTHFVHIMGTLIVRYGGYSLAPLSCTGFRVWWPSSGMRAVHHWLYSTLSACLNGY